MAEKPIVSVVVINYNGKALLKGCLDSVCAQTYPNIELILVDNGSEDGSIEFIKEHYSNISIIENRKNLGYAPAANIGIRRSKGECVAILNNDTRTDPAWISALIETMQSDPMIGSACPKQLKLDDPAIIDAAGAVLHRGAYQTNRGSGEKDSGQYGITEEVFGVSGAAALYRRKMLDDVGVFDEDFVSYQEEFDLSMRARLRGWKSIYVHDSIVYHIGGKTKAESDKNFLTFFMERNRLLVIVKDYPFMVIAKNLLYMVKYELDVFIRLLRRLETEPIKARANFLIMLPGAFKKRVVIQRSKIVRDDSIEKWIVR